MPHLLTVFFFTEATPRQYMRQDRFEVPDCVRGLSPRIAVVWKRTTLVHLRNADEADVCDKDIVDASLLFDSGYGDKRRLARILR